MNWGTFLAFWIGGFAGAGLLAYLSRGARDHEARELMRAGEAATRYGMLLRYVALNGLRCPEGANYRGWLALVETAMVKQETERLEALRRGITRIDESDARAREQ